MFIPHFPTVEMTHFLLKLQNNRPFLYISRIFMLSLVALCAVGYAGEWATGLEPHMPGCTIPRWGCYQGPALTLPDFIFKLGAPQYLFLLPGMALVAAFVLLLKPPRMYLLVMLLSWASFLIVMFGAYPNPYTNALSGSGYWLAVLGLFFLSLLCIPLSLVEQTNLLTVYQE
jgi:hypothetical protein